MEEVSSKVVDWAVKGRNFGQWLMIAAKTLASLLRRAEWIDLFCCNSAASDATVTDLEAALAGYGWYGWYGWYGRSRVLGIDPKVQGATRVARITLGMVENGRQPRGLFAHLLLLEALTLGL